MNKQPPSNLWDTLPAIVKKLTNEFLIVTIAYWLLAIAIGSYAPSVVNLLGREFFILIVVLGFVAYLVSVIIRGFLGTNRYASRRSLPPLPIALVIRGLSKSLHLLLPSRPNPKPCARATCACYGTSASISR